MGLSFCGSLICYIANISIEIISQNVDKFLYKKEFMK